MSDKELVYRCFKCDSQKEYTDKSSSPICCGEAMKAEKLPQCTTAPHAEMARNYDEDAPCNDDTANK